LYVDESGFAATTQRDYGWAPRGQKVQGLRSGNRRPRTSLLAALRHKRLLAPWLLDGTCNSLIFNTWLRQALRPYLNADTVVVLDNASFHKSQETEQIITETGAHLLFLPPYSPHLMPIEHTFGTLKKRRAYHPHLTLDQIVCMSC